MAAAMLGGSALSAAGSLFGASKSAKAAKNASAQQVAASRQAMQQNQQFYNQGRADLEPFRQFGMENLSQLSNIPEYTFNYQQDPGYQFRMNEGNKAIDRMTASGRLPGGGATLKALTRFGQDYASNEYANSFNRDYGMYQDRFNRAAGNANIGLGAASSLASLGMNYAGANSNLITGMGNAQAAGTVGKANAWNQGMQGAGNSIMDAVTLRSLMGEQKPPTQYQAAVPNSFSRMYMK